MNRLIGSCILNAVHAEFQVSKMVLKHDGLIGYQRMKVRNWYVRGLINQIHFAKELLSRPGREIPTETPRKTSRERPTEIRKEIPRETSRETPREIPTETPRKTSGERPTEIRQESPRPVVSVQHISN